jgi:hypothetical protein
MSPSTIADTSFDRANLPLVRCYFILVHGRLKWVPGRMAGDELGAMRPAGFHCHRYVLAANEDEAVETAFRRVRDNLDHQFGWLRDGLATVELEAEEVATAPIRKLLKGDNRGHTFYERE